MSKNLKLVTLDALKYFKDKIEPVSEKTGDLIQIENATSSDNLNIIVEGKETQTKTKSTNLLTFPYFEGSVGASVTRAGVTFTVQGDGGIHAKGTANGSAYIILKKMNIGESGISTTHGESSGSNEEYTLSKFMYYDPKEKYVYLNIYSNQNLVIDEIIYPQVNRGKILLSYESPLGMILPPSPKIPIYPEFVEGEEIKICGENLLEPEYIYRQGDSNLRYKSAIHTPTDKGLFLKKGQTYTFMTTGKGVAGLYVNNFQYSEKKYYQYNTQKIRYTPKENEEVELDSYWMNSSMPADAEIMLTLGNKDIPYEDYYDGGKVKIPTLRALPGEIKDEFNATTGELTRRVGELILKGNESWSKISTLVDNSDAYFQMDTPLDILDTDEENCLSSHYPKNDIYNGNSLQGVNIVWKRIRIRWRDQMGLDENNFKAYLAEQYEKGTPVKVYYHLANSQAEHYPIQKLMLREGVNNIILNNGKAKVSYYKNNFTGKILNNISAIYFQKKGGKITGPIQLTKNVHYGKPTPTIGEEGEIFFEDFNGTFTEDISAPSFIENGVPLNQKYAFESQIPYQLSQLTADSLHQTVSGVEKERWNKAIQIKKIWENASPNSDFAPQTITGIDISDAKFFIVVSIIRGNEAHYSACLAENKINQETWVNMIWGDVWVARSVTPRTNGLEFGNGKYHNDSAYLTDPTYCKPIRIYKIV